MKLNIGAGKCPIEGYLNLDKSTFGLHDAFSYVEGEAYPLPASYQNENAFFDEIRASHILEHFSHRQTLDVLKEWVRVLAPGGVLKVAVPDFEYIVNGYRQARTDEPLEGYLMGGQTDENDYHKAIFDEAGLRCLLEAAGLTDIQPWKSEIPDCAALPVSLNLQGTKPDPNREVVTERNAAEGEAGISPDAETVTVSRAQLKADIKAVMTMPRLAWTDNIFCGIEAVAQLGIGLERRGGVFWGQGMTHLFESHLEDGTKYLLTLDYDSIFTPEDILQLYATMEANPDFDALCAMQMKRESDSPLFFMRDKAGRGMDRVGRSDMEKDLLRISSAHFGLTVLRVEAIARMLKPWFHSIPDEDESWGDGRVDEDVAFWKKWAECGNTLYQANRVSIGHCQVLVTWPNRELQPLHQYVSDYHKDGKPEGCWR